MFSLFHSAFRFRAWLTGWLLVGLFSCSPKAIGYRSYPLEPAYIPRRIELNIGPIVLLDIQVIKNK